MAVLVLLYNALHICDNVVVTKLWLVIWKHRTQFGTVNNVINGYMIDLCIYYTTVLFVFVCIPSPYKENSKLCYASSSLTHFVFTYMSYILHLRLLIASFSPVLDLISYYFAHMALSLIGYVICLFSLYSLDM